jgi:transposase
LVRIIWYKVHYRIDDKTVKRLWQQQPMPVLGESSVGAYHRHADRYQARLQVVKLSYQGWTKSSISHFMQVSRPTVDLWIRRFEAEHFAGLEDQSRAPHTTPRKVWLPLMIEIYHLQKRHPDAGEFRIWSLLARSDVSVRTIGRVMDDVASSHRFTTYPVLDGGSPVGLLPFASVAAVPRSEWETRRVRDTMISLDEVPLLTEDEKELGVALVDTQLVESGFNGLRNRSSGGQDPFHWLPTSSSSSCASGDVASGPTSPGADPCSRRHRDPRPWTPWRRASASRAAGARASPSRRAPSSLRAPPSSREPAWRASGVPRSACRRTGNDTCSVSVYKSLEET